MTKESLRRTYRQRRRDLTPVERQLAEARITQATLAALQGRGPVLIYVAVRAEFNTRPLIRALLEASVEVAVPRIEGEHLRAARLHDLAELVPGPFGVPTSTGPQVRVDACVTPGLAFTRQGVRLGQGGGYYDRFFSVNPLAWRIAPAFEIQIAPSLPAEDHDVPVHRVLTEISLGPDDPTA